MGGLARAVYAFKDDQAADGSTKTQVFRYNGTIVKDGSDYKVVSLGDAKKVSEKTE